MKASIVEHVSATKAQAARSEAMKKLIDGLLEKVSFEIPDSMLNARVERVVQEQAMKLQRMGLDDLRKDQAQEEKREEAKKEALETLRPQVFLMALAQKENITVTIRKWKWPSTAWPCAPSRTTRRSAKPITRAA